MPPPCVPGLGDTLATEPGFSDPLGCAGRGDLPVRLPGRGGLFEASGADSAGPLHVLPSRLLGRFGIAGLDSADDPLVLGHDLPRAPPVRRGRLAEAAD